jgi:hypothetical protein
MKLRVERYPAHTGFGTLFTLHETHGFTVDYCVKRNAVMRHAQARFRNIVVIRGNPDVSSSHSA